MTTSYLSIKQWLNSNEGIHALDPLLFDDNIARLHALNREKDIREMVQMLYQHLPVPDALDAYSYDESIAAMRDLGIFIGILKRHGIEPVEAVPELEYVLLVLMVKTALPPRDTLIHYTMWNPSGSRMRTYTGLDDEACLIESVKMAYPALMEAIGLLDLISDMPHYGADFEKYCFHVHELMSGMVKGIVHAKKHVSPSVFANELRFYYDPIKVDYDRQYLGPGAVEMPMFVFDHLLWSSDCSDSEYTSFKEGYLPYNLPIIREIYQKFESRPSLVSKIIDNLRIRPSKENLSAARVVQELGTLLKSFRMPHKRLAEDAYAQKDEQHRSEGSGGYSVDILQHIIKLQNTKLTSLQEQIDAARMRVAVK